MRRSYYTLEQQVRTMLTTSVAQSTRTSPERKRSITSFFARGPRQAWRTSTICACEGGSIFLGNRMRAWQDVFYWNRLLSAVAGPFREQRNREPKGSMRSLPLGQTSGTMCTYRSQGSDEMIFRQLSPVINLTFSSVSGGIVAEVARTDTLRGRNEGSVSGDV